MSTTSADIAAEQALLGSVMQWPNEAGPALLLLDQSDWYQPRNAELGVTLTDMLRQQKPIDPATVLSELLTRGMIRSGYLDGSYLFQLIERSWGPSGTLQYAAAIRDHRRRRSTAEAAIRLGQKLDAPDSPLHEILAQHESDLAQILPPLEDTVVTPPMTIRELIQQTDWAHAFDWLIPGLCERTERIVLTGGEGGGKSELLAQWACCVAAGIHPFTGFPTGTGGHRVMIADFENSSRQAARRFERIARLVDAYPGVQSDWQDRIFFEAWGRSEISNDDRTRFEASIASASPDLIVTGPAYQMGILDPNSETEVLKFTAVLDKVRLRHGAALLLEAHPGHGTNGEGKRLMRPSGSSTWLRWPEMGIGLQRSDRDSGNARPDNVDITLWRSPREGRSWPRRLRAGVQRELPWVADDQRYLDEMRFDRERLANAN